MKIAGSFLFVITCVFILINSVSAQGEFAGAKIRTLIGKQYNNDKELPGLPDYSYEAVDLASDIDDPVQYVVGIFKKKNTWLVFFGINKENTTDNYTILDAMVIKHVRPDEKVRTVLCRKDKISEWEIVALVKKEPGSTVLKTWRFNRQKNKIESYNKSGVDCLPEEN